MSQRGSVHRRSGRAGGVTPLPIPAAALRRVKVVLVYGGTFNPPHRLHIEGPRCACRRLYADSGWVLYVPAARSPHKSGASAPASDRVAMLRLALASGASGASPATAGASIWLDEVERTEEGRASYTVDTIKRLRAVLPGRIGLRLLIGADQAAAFHRWKSPRQLLTLAPPLVMLRDPIASPAALYEVLDAARFWTAAELRAWCAGLAPTPILPSASTKIRSAFSGRQTAGANSGLHPAVRRYIREHGLYRKS